MDTIKILIFARLVILLVCNVMDLHNINVQIVIKDYGFHKDNV